MSNQDNGERERLTLADPVGEQTLAQLAQVQKAHSQVAQRMLRLEQDKVQLLLMAKQLDQENNKIFAMMLQERGLPANTPVDLDISTGRLTLQETAQPQTASQEDSSSSQEDSSSQEGAASTTG